jgi:hypothetical protein
MSVAERIDGDAAAEIEVAVAILGKEIGTLAPGERKIAAGVGRKERRHGIDVVPK